jgi:hypothetical protein
VAARAGRDEHGRVLVEATVAVLPGWVERSVTSRLPAGSAVEDGDVGALIARAAAAAVEDGRPRLEAAVTREPGIDPGPAPLQVLRSLVRHPTDALLALGVPGVDRPAFETEAFPDDVYDLSPATWADVHPSLHEPGLAWGAATAYLHKVRRRTV